MHAGYFLGKMKNQNITFINLILLGLRGGLDTSLKSPNYPKMLKFLVFVLETYFLAYRLLFGPDEEPVP